MPFFTQTIQCLGFRSVISELAPPVFYGLQRSLKQPREPPGWGVGPQSGQGEAGGFWPVMTKFINWMPSLRSMIPLPSTSALSMHSTRLFSSTSAKIALASLTSMFPFPSTSPRMNRRRDFSLGRNPRSVLVPSSSGGLAGSPASAAGESVKSSSRPGVYFR